MVICLWLTDCGLCERQHKGLTKTRCGLWSLLWTPALGLALCWYRHPQHASDLTIKTSGTCSAFSPESFAVLQPQMDVVGDSRYFEAGTSIQLPFSIDFLSNNCVQPWLRQNDSRTLIKVRCTPHNPECPGLNAPWGSLTPCYFSCARRWLTWMPKESFLNSGREKIFWASHYLNLPFLSEPISWVASWFLRLWLINWLVILIFINCPEGKGIPGPIPGLLPAVGTPNTGHFWWPRLSDCSKNASPHWLFPWVRHYPCQSSPLPCYPHRHFPNKILACSIQSWHLLLRRSNVCDGRLWCQMEAGQRAQPSFTRLSMSLSQWLNIDTDKDISYLCIVLLI